MLRIIVLIKWPTIIKLLIDQLNDTRDWAGNSPRDNPIFDVLDYCAFLAPYHIFQQLSQRVPMEIITSTMQSWTVTYIKYADDIQKALWLDRSLASIRYAVELISPLSHIVTKRLTRCYHEVQSIATQASVREGNAIKQGNFTHTHTHTPNTHMADVNK